MLAQMRGLTKSFAQKILFENVTAAIEENDRIGFIGDNGAGKSTLINILMGEQSSDSGDILVKNNLITGYLRQNSGVSPINTIRQEMYSAADSLTAAKKELDDLQARLARQKPGDGERAGLNARVAQLQAYYEVNGGYQLDANINIVLNGMGFSSFSLDTVCGELSGGERTRLALAKLLLKAPELLVLDEPTNHLDFNALQWLEEYLSRYKGAILAVSHDRYFLDKVCSKIWDLESRRFFTFKGNYSKAMGERELLLARMRDDYEKREREIEKLTDYVARNKVRASTAAMAKSREKQRDALVAEQERFVLSAPVKFSFPYKDEPVKTVLEVENLVLFAGGNPAAPVIARELAFSMERGEKLALIGGNGCGKSSLLKTLLTPKQAQGRVIWGKNTRLSYFEQGTEDLRDSFTIIEELWSRYPQATELEVRSGLARVGFCGESVFEKVGSLSGGEKARLKIAHMMWENGNVLLLDEPTNHLDLRMKEALEQALISFSGSLLFISHDRYLLTRVPTRILELSDGVLKSYSGNYDAYLAAKQRERAEITLEAPEKKQDAKPVASAYYKGKKQRALEAARAGKISSLEKEITSIEQSISELEAQLAAPQAASDYQKAQELCAELDAQNARLVQAMDEWETLSSQAEQQRT